MAILISAESIMPMGADAWNWRRVFWVLGLSISEQKIAVHQQPNEVIYRGVRVILLPVENFELRRAGKARIIVECGCGKTVGYGRMVQHAKACNDARATLCGKDWLCSCEDCVIADRWVDYGECAKIKQG